MEDKELIMTIARMDAADVRRIVIITGTLVFAFGLFLAREYFMAQIEVPARKVKPSFKDRIGIFFQIAAVVFVIMCPELYERILASAAEF